MVQPVYAQLRKCPSRPGTYPWCRTQNRRHVVARHAQSSWSRGLFAGARALESAASSLGGELARFHELRSQSADFWAIHFHSNVMIFSAAYENTNPANTAAKIARFWCCGVRPRFILAIRTNIPPIAI